MFQKVGLADIFIGLWNRKIKIVIVAVIAFILALAYVGVGILKADKSEPESTYLESVTYYIDSLEKAEGVDPFYQSQKVRAAYMTLFDSELFAEYLQKNVGGDEELGAYLKVASDDSTKTIVISDKNIDSIYRAMAFEASQNASTLRVYFTCTDEEMGEKIIDACYKFATEEISTKINPSSFTEIGRSVYEKQVVAEQSLGGIIKSVVKQTVVYAVVLEFVYILIAAFGMIFRPVVNRRSDLEEYTDAPIWELR